MERHWTAGGVRPGVFDGPVAFRRISFRRVGEESRVLRRIILGTMAIGLVACAAYAAFYVAPEERTMGAIQRIFYFHASTAWAGETTFFVCFASNLLYIWKRNPQYACLGLPSAESRTASTPAHLITPPSSPQPLS